MVTTRRKPKRIKVKQVWKEVLKEPRGYYQLQGRYMFWNTRTGEFAFATGYSTCTRSKRRDKELQILREQAIDHAIDRLGGLSSGEWVLQGIEHEVWLKW